MQFSLEVRCVHRRPFHGSRFGPMIEIRRMVGATFGRIQVHIIADLIESLSFFLL